MKRCAYGGVNIVLSGFALISGKSYLVEKAAQSVDDVTKLFAEALLLVHGQWLLARV
jgi:hypothetical protein